MPQSDLVEQFKRFYADLRKAEWAQLDAIYASNVQYRDPAHLVVGRDALYRYLDSLCADVTTCRFVYLDQMLGDGSFYIKWNMHYAHPRVAGNKAITVRGVSHVMSGKEGIHYHEDFYDMGEMLYEHLPLMGRVVGWVKGNLGEAAA